MYVHLHTLQHSGSGEPICRKMKLKSGETEQIKRLEDERTPTGESEETDPRSTALGPAWLQNLTASLEWMCEASCLVPICLTLRAWCQTTFVLS